VAAHRHPTHPAAQSSPSVAASITPTEDHPASTIVTTPKPLHKTKKHETRSRQHRTHQPPVVHDPGPGGTTGNATPTPPPTVTPSGDPTPSVAPIPPAPAWTFAFSAAFTSIDPCQCDGFEPELQASQLEGSLDTQFHFTQQVKGVALDADGARRWPFYFEVTGDADQDLGKIEFKFILSSPAGPTWYDGTAYATAPTKNDDGSVVYTFEGSFAPQKGEDVFAGVPTGGDVQATFSIWPDGTIYGGSVQLSDAAP
jgi:hypothetical protein